MSEKSTFDLSSITGPYQLLGAFLIVLEAILLLWMRSAEHMVERIVAGFLMTLIFVFFIYTVGSMKKDEEQSKRISPPGLSELTVAEEVTTEDEIKNPEPQRLSSQDGSYTINAPPEGWSVRELSMGEWIKESLQITDPTLDAKLFGGPDQSTAILSIMSRTTTSVTPIPGKTIISGRKYPSALQISIPMRLGIIQVGRYQPPLYTEFPLEHNFMNLVSTTFQISLLTLYDIRSGKIKNSSLRFLEADFRQEIRNAIVNNRENTNVNSNVVIIGIEGELQDYLLLLNYPSLPEAGDPVLEKDLDTLMSIVSSFRPLKTIEPDKKNRELEEAADHEFETLIEKNGRMIFSSEFDLALLKLSGYDMEDPEQRLNAIKMLRPFENLSGMLGLHDKGLDELWVSLHDAEKGKASDFMDNVARFISLAKGETVLKEDSEDPLKMNYGEAG